MMIHYPLKIIIEYNKPLELGTLEIGGLYTHSHHPRKEREDEGYAKMKLGGRQLIKESQVASDLRLC